MTTDDALGVTEPMTALSAASSGPKEQLILAAERLFSARGTEGVSLREIGLAAGNLNNSAVQYHFGSKDQLIGAIVAYRQPEILARRRSLMEQHPPVTVRGWVECQVRTVVELADVPEGHYFGFLAELHYRRLPESVDLPTDQRTEIRQFHDRLPKLLPGLAEPLRTHRISRAQTFLIHAAADREFGRDSGMELFPLDVEVSDLVDGVVGFLEAPTSAASRKALRGKKIPASVFLV